MLLKTELSSQHRAVVKEKNAFTFREKFILFAALSWGLCAFFPIGVVYLNLILMLLALGVIPNLALWLRAVRQGGIFAPVLASLVAAHYVWGTPHWAIGNGHLSSRNNFSSGNMIPLAVASGVFFMVSGGDSRGGRWLALVAALALGVIVALHVPSRNSQLLPVVMTVVLYRYRSLLAVWEHGLASAFRGWWDPPGNGSCHLCNGIGKRAFSKCGARHELALVAGRKRSCPQERGRQ